MNIRHIMMAAFVLFGLTVLVPSSADACGVTEEQCNRNALGITFEGNVQIPNPIRVEVCHGYWDQIDIGTYRGQQTRWWGPVMVYNNWYGDLPIATSQCKTYWVRPGTELRLYASCVEDLISTGRMTRPGRYIMTIENAA